MRGQIVGLPLARQGAKAGPDFRHYFDGRRDEGLASKPRLDTHDEYQIALADE